MNLVITNDALYQLSYTSELRRRGTYSIIPNPAAECKVFFALFFRFIRASAHYARHACRHYPKSRRCTAQKVQCLAPFAAILRAGTQIP